MILPADFFDRPVVRVARDLLGARLVRVENGLRTAGIILETEAYRGEEDLACHARAGRTPRTEVMFGPPGCAYVYFNYGMHWCLNCVCEKEGFPAAVLIRAIQPVENQDLIAVRRSGLPEKSWCDGPAKLCKALNIDGRFNGTSLVEIGNGLIVEQGAQVPDELVITSSRVGIENVPEPWKSVPWRFKAQLNPLPLMSGNGNIRNN